MGRIARCLALVMSVTVCAITAMPAGAATATKGVAYGGLTSQKSVLAVVLNPAGTVVKSIRFPWSAPCTPGPAGTATTPGATAWTDELLTIPIKKGKFKATISAGPFTEGSVLQKFRYTVGGKRLGGYLVGSIRATFTESALTGEVVRTCDSGAVTFKVKEKDVFAGPTAQTRPIVIAMNATRRKVTRMDWEWSGACTPGPAARPDTDTELLLRDFLTDLPVSAAGKFGGAFTFDPQVDAASGIAANYSNQVSARRVGRIIKGTVRGTVVEVDASGGPLHGQVIRSCTSGPVKFTIQD